MIKETVRDIPPFMILFSIVIGMFANAMLILDQTQWQRAIDAGEGDSYEEILPQYTGYRSTDAWVVNYLLSFGDFGYTEDNFRKTRDSIGFLWFYFVLSTIFTNICFLNILIAIVSDTYARITENRERYSFM